MVIKPMVRNSICINAHPTGCELDTERQIEYVRDRRGDYDRLAGPKAVLVLGCSTGYGLATRIGAAFGFGTPTVGVSYEKEPSENSTGTPGWYNNRAFDAAATAASLPSFTINGDAFSKETKAKVVAAARELGLKFDLVAYSLASPVRTDPETGEMYRSVIKPIGGAYSGRTVNPFTRELSFVEVQSATEAEIESTVKVMGGEDWELWISALAEAGVLADKATTVAYSYVGPRLSWPIYREGTIGKAKAHLEATSSSLPAKAKALSPAGSSPVELRAYVSVNKALVTRASAVIPVIPLYMALLFRVMKERGIHEDCIAQIDRMYRDRLYSGSPLALDEEGRIRLDELEMGQAVQAEVESRMQQVRDDNLMELADVEGFRLDFLRAHGFEVEGVDYEDEITPQGLLLSPEGGTKAKRLPMAGQRPARNWDSASLPGGMV
jgi:enoyl-[acyl-carrier protein] reductase / trans-2-enoyl-CoA reductase (NAD+)